jgi:hypothetical protein
MAAQADEPWPAPPELRPHPTEIDVRLERLTALAQPIALAWRYRPSRIRRYCRRARHRTSMSGKESCPVQIATLPLPAANVDRSIPLASGAAHERAPHF